MMHCRRVATDLVAYAFGDLEEDSTWLVEAHLCVCSPCQAEVLRYRMLRRLTDQLPLLTPPAHLLERLWARVVHPCKRRLSRNGVKGGGNEFAMMNCQDVTDILYEFVSGERIPARAEEVQFHLQQCESCRGALKQYEQMIQLVRGLHGVPPPRRILDRLRSTLKQSTRGKSMDS